MDNAAVKKLIRSRWRYYDPCTSVGIQSYEARLPIIMDQELVTPASIANDLKLELVYSNYEHE